MHGFLYICVRLGVCNYVIYFYLLGIYFVFTFAVRNEANISVLCVWANHVRLFDFSVFERHVFINK